MQDYTAHIITDAQALIEQLAAQETITRQMRGSQRRQEENKCRKLRHQLLQQTDASSTYLYLNATNAAQDVDFRTEWQTGALRVDRVAFLKQWGIENLYQDHWAAPAPILSILPPYSFFLQFTFTLIKPYLSKNDNSFYIIDNPIARDKVFQLPLVRPTSWKGSLCAALWQLGYQKEQDKRIQRLFGDIRDNESGQAGRLRFYPTFFTQTGLEIINPHDREKHVGENPILFESVPLNAEGTFTLLYVPFDLIGQSKNDVRAQATEDLLLLAQGLQAMFCIYGFGAKTSSGFGVAEARVENASLVLNAPDKPPASPKPIAPQLPQEVQAFRKESPNEDFQLKPKAWCKQPGTTSSQRGPYIKARGAYRKYKEQYVAYEKSLSEWESTADAPTPALTPRSFTTFNELITEAQKLAQSQQGGAE